MNKTIGILLACGAILIGLNVFAMAQSKRYLDQNNVLVVPPGVTEIELMYVDADGSILLRRSMEVKGEQKFVVRTRK